MAQRNNEPGERMPGLPRSLQELSFAASARACARCGDRSELEWKHGGTDELYRTHATCPKCGTERVYVFVTEQDLTDVYPPELELGAGSSTVLDPHDLVAYIDHLEPMIKTPLAPPTAIFDPNWEYVERVQTALNELNKFVRPGASAVAAGAFRDQRGLADYAARPERYSKQWIDAAIARYAKLVDDVPTPRSAPQVTTRGSIDRASLSAHRDWYRTGKGTRLDVAGLSVRGMKLDAIEVVRGRFESVDFHSANFQQSNFSQGEFRACKFDNGKLDHAKFESSTFLDCSFNGTAGAMLDLTKTKVSGCSFEHAGIPGCEWTGATVSSTKFTGASFGNARWDYATFVDCDFRDASLEPAREIPPTRMRGVVFDGCDFRNANFKGSDLRGATFKRCKLVGARGEPKCTSELTLTDCDVSTSTFLQQLSPPPMSADEVRAHPSYVVAEDHEDGRNVVYDTSNKGAQRLGTTSASPTASTFGRNRIVWQSTDQAFIVWTPDGCPLACTRSEIKTPGGTMPLEAVNRVVSFIDTEQRGRRGVALITPKGRVPRLVVVQENDILAYEDANYTLDDARRDARWAALLGKDLAQWLGVPHDELRTDLK